MGFQFSSSLKPVWDFTVQVVVGAFLFTVILLVAVALAALVKGIEKLDVAPEWLLDGAHWVEWGLFWFDVFSFSLFLIAEILKLGRALWNEWRET